MTSKIAVPDEPVPLGGMDDFRNFQYLVWRHLRLTDPTPVQYDIAHHMQWGPKKQFASAFRGVGKSITASAFATWAFRLIYWHPDIRPEYSVMVVSASKIRADDFSTFTLRLLEEMPLLRDLIPRDDARHSKISFDVARAPAQHSPSCYSRGITGALTGARADLIIADDIESLSNSLNQIQRDKLQMLVREFEDIIKPVPPDEEIRRRFPHLPLDLAKCLLGRVIYLGTPQSIESIYTKINYDRRLWPARYPDSRWMNANGEYLAPSLKEKLEPPMVGRPTDTRFSDDDLLDREARKGRSAFSLQFMLDTSLNDSDRYPLKLRDLVVMDTDAETAPERVAWSSGLEYVIKDLSSIGIHGDRYYSPMQLIGGWVKYTGAVMFIDPAGRGKDETAYSVVKMLSSQLFCRACTGFGPSMGYEDEVLQKLADAAKFHRVNKILVESNFGDGMFERLLTPFLRRTYPCTMESVRRSIRKEKRIIDTLEPVMNQHRLVMDKAVILEDGRAMPGLPEEEAIQYQLMYQMTRLTNEKGCLAHDDRLDALSGAVGFFVEQMAQDATRQMKVREDRALDAELREFVRSARRGGHRVRATRRTEPNWNQGVLGRWT